MVKHLGVTPIARMVTCTSGGVDPLYMGIGPVEAIPKALDQAGLKLSDIEQTELNEAFACQALAVIQEAGLDPSTVNVNGGAIAEARFYNTCLTSAEVALLYKETFIHGGHAAGKYSSLVDWFTFGNKQVIKPGFRGSKEFDRVLANYNNDEESFTGLRKRRVALSLDGAFQNARDVVSNGTFDSDISGWTQDNGVGTSSYHWGQASGKAKSLGHLDELQLNFTPTIGNTYKLSYAKTGNSASAHVQPYVGGVTGTMGTDQNHTVTDEVYRAVSTQTLRMVSVVLADAGTAYAEIDNVSLKEYFTPGLVPKNFATSAFKSMKLLSGGFL